MDTTGTRPRSIATLFDDGKPFWHLQVVGVPNSRPNVAIGGIAESFQAVRLSVKRELRS